MRGLGRALAAAVALVALVALAAPWPASARSFTIAAVQVEATLLPDASLRVVEHLTYDFEGRYSRGSRPIPPGDYSIVDMTVTEQGRPLPFEGAPHDLAWHYEASDERRTFEVAYTVLGAAGVGPDVGELFWQFVGPDHPGIGAVRVALDVPGDGLDVRAWAHGPLSGALEVRGTRVLMSVDGLPAGRFVEGRVAVPAANFSVVPAGAPRLAGILAEEQVLADRANAERRAADEAARRRQRLEEAARWFWVVPPAGLAVFAWLWLRYGREHAPATDVGPYLREPPPDPPAYVPTLLAWGKVEPVVLSATIVDLAQRGHLTITEVRTDRRFLGDRIDWRLARTEEPPGAELLDFERAVLAQLFAEGPETTQSRFRTWCTRHRTDAWRWWQGVQRKVERGYRRQGWVEGGKGPVYAANLACGAAVAGLGLGTLMLGTVSGLAGLAAGGAQLAATPLLRRRTPAGAQRVAEWQAFERYLKDFSRLEEAPVGHLVLWERYLVYAVALGVAGPVARALAARIPAEVAAGQASSTFAPWFSGGDGPGDLGSIGSMGGFARDFGPVVVAAATPPSSSSSGSGFGGGGFSGGGGGGGGGGGMGAS